MRTEHRAVEQWLECVEGWGGNSRGGQSGAVLNSFVFVGGLLARQAVCIVQYCNRLLRCAHPLVEFFLKKLGRGDTTT